MKYAFFITYLQVCIRMNIAISKCDTMVDGVMRSNHDTTSTIQMVALQQPSRPNSLMRSFFVVSGTIRFMKIYCNNSLY
jgi:hypothetical protein